MTELTSFWKYNLKKSAFDMVDIQRTRKDVNNVLEKNPLIKKL
jgi:hypothetical protein